jgi:hypothetical protein
MVLILLCVGKCSHAVSVIVWFLRLCCLHLTRWMDLVPQFLRTRIQKKTKKWEGQDSSEVTLAYGTPFKIQEHNFSPTLATIKDPHLVVLKHYRIQNVNGHLTQCQGTTKDDGGARQSQQYWAPFIWIVLKIAKTPVQWCTFHLLTDIFILLDYLL